MRTNYVLIDYENVQPASLSVLDAEHFRVVVFVGASQTKVSFEAASVLQRMGARAEYIKISANGSNALDFHIAFYIGHFSTLDPTAYFHIISKDTGFDPLIQHLKERKVFAARSKDVGDIPLVKVGNSKTPTERLSVVIANLQQRGASRPRTSKTLASTIGSIFQKQLSDDELAALVDELQLKGFVTIVGTKVSYALPSAET